MTGDTGRTEHSIGEVFRRFGPEYSRTRAMSRPQRRVMKDLAACRTSALGGHVEACSECGFERPVYNSCGNRHCPTCQGKLSRKWLQRQMGRVLATAYFHCVFTIPSQFNVLVARNESVFYGILFRASWFTLRSLSRKYLQGEPGVVSVLHTWGQTLCEHPHIHAIVTGGALSPDRTCWNSSEPDYLFDVYEMSALFRKRFCDLLRKAELTLTGEYGAPGTRDQLLALIDEQEAREWVVYTKKPFAGPQQVLEYISRYTHRVAISNRRIVGVSNEGVRITYKDYRKCDESGRPEEKVMPLTGTDFIRRFLRHVLPHGFRKIRSYGILAGPNSEEKLAACRELLGPPEITDLDDHNGASADVPECPRCGGRAFQVTRALPAERAPPLILACVTRVHPHAA